MTMLSISNQKLDDDGIASYGHSPEFTCIGAGACKLPCFAKHGRYHFPCVKEKLLRNYEASKQDDFVKRMSAEIYLNGCKTFRIHTVGDFYSGEYIDKWIDICYQLKDVQFYCYTKTVPYFTNGRLYNLPTNLRVVFSYGGKYDHLIPEGAPHCHIFRTKRECIKAGYKYANDSDLVALKYDKVGIVYHGNKTKEYQTYGK